MPVSRGAGSSRWQRLLRWLAVGEPREPLPSVTDHFYKYYLPAMLALVGAFRGGQLLLSGGWQSKALGSLLAIPSALAIGLALVYVLRPVDRAGNAAETDETAPGGS